MVERGTEFSMGDPGSSGRMITLPPEYQTYMDAAEDSPIQMPQGDFQFITDLQRRFNIDGNRAEADFGEFGRREFFLALGALIAYGEALRSLDRGFSNNEPVFEGDPTERAKIYDDFRASERSRPSTGRLSDLSYLFLHLPGVKNQYMQMQAEKMAEAFSPFRESLKKQPIGDIPDRHTYFAKAHQLMTSSMIPVVQSTYHPYEIDQLSWVIGYENHLYQPPKASRLTMVAGVGNETFTNLLEQVVDEAQGENLRVKLRKEFMHRDGIGFRAMRVPLRSFGLRLEPALKRGLGEGRTILDQESFGIGVCPATYKMPEAGGGTTERPIAFEYASAIVGRMPRQLPARRSS